MTGSQLAAVDHHGERPPHLDFMVDERLADARDQLIVERSGDRIVLTADYGFVPVIAIGEADVAEPACAIADW